MRIGIRAGQSVIEKAQRNLSKLTKKVITNKKGHKQTVWVRPGEAPAAKPGKPADPDKPASKKGETSGKKFKPGDKVICNYFNPDTRKNEPIPATIVQVYRSGEAIVKKENGEKLRTAIPYLKKPQKPGIQKPGGGGKGPAASVKRGDQVSGTDVNGKEVSGTVTAVGGDGVTVDREFHIEHGKFTGKQIQGKVDRNTKKIQSKKKPKKEGGKFKPGDKLLYDYRGMFGQEGEPTPVTFVGYQKNGRVTVKNDENGAELDVPPDFLKAAESKKTGPYIPPEKFTASDWVRQYSDPKATPDESGQDYILDSFGAEGETIANAIRDADSKNLRIEKAGENTHDKYRIPPTMGESARYSEEREKIHGRIMTELLSPDKIRTALPPPGEKPKFIMLGGRGGSGKSWFENNLYDPAKCVILDADKIKEQLPEYKGWNANQVHEESSDILEQMLATCIKNGLNVVLDATMKTADSALAKVFRFKSAGYKTEAHYMFCPAHEAAKRAIKRFKGQPEKGKEGEFMPYNGRYVPVTAVLKNTTNEASFDQIKGLVDDWSFRDNFNKKSQNDPPIIISEGSRGLKKSFSSLVKSIIQAHN
jgi:predicted kinase